MTVGDGGDSAAADVGPSPAPGSGRPATDTRLGRVGVAVIVVVALLYLIGWIAWSTFGPEVGIDDDPGHERDRAEPHGPGRLTSTGPWNRESIS